ncbi:CmcI family methyltransferase [Brevundimonas sp. UBA2416]|uniref:CmcI family methyltransferase n=1 Tax=Brevundimonas sp. UBA2416 TaxID=1946124 RepID=UPI0025BCB685|nr:CmcI family methyltransferase [Brevundimonas sp. UBA2416]
METPEDKFREVRAALAHVGFPDESVARSRICDVLGERGGIPTYLDNHMLGVLSRGTSNRGEADMLKLYCARLIGSEPRFLSWEERQSQLQAFGFYTEVDYRGMLYSQGTSAPYEWRGQACFKTVYEIALYPLMLAEVRPQNIVELGAGAGGSAAWFRDMCMALNVDATVHAIDLNTDDRTQPGIITYRGDCIEWLQERRRDRKLVGVPLLVIEDFHGDLEETLGALDDLLRPGDYLVIEDAIPKQAAMARALRHRPYVIDSRYTDFFGVNSTSAVNGILKRI